MSQAPPDPFEDAMQVLATWELTCLDTPARPVCMVAMGTAGQVGQLLVCVRAEFSDVAVIRLLERALQILRARERAPA